MKSEDPEGLDYYLLTCEGRVGGVWTPKVTLSSRPLHYFTFYSMLSESKHTFTSLSAPDVGLAVQQLSLPDATWLNASRAAAVSFKLHCCFFSRHHIRVSQIFRKKQVGDSLSGHRHLIHLYVTVTLSSWTISKKHTLSAHNKQEKKSLLCEDQVRQLFSMFGPRSELPSRKLCDTK